MKLIIYNSFLGIIIHIYIYIFNNNKFLSNSLVILIIVVFATTLNFAKCHTAIWTHDTGFVSSLMCWAHFIFSWPHHYVINLMEDESFY